MWRIANIDLCYLCAFLDIYMYEYEDKMAWVFKYLKLNSIWRLANLFI